MSEKVLMKGNEAFAEAVIRGGCRFYFGYPITPQSEIPEFMSRELPKRGGRFLQAESMVQNSSSMVRGSKEPRRMRTSGAASQTERRSWGRRLPSFHSQPQEEISMPLMTISR